MMKRLIRPLSVAVLLAAAGTVLRAQQIPAPESHFGFRLGADGRMASWSQLVSYYQKLGATSDRVTVRELGKTTLGRPFLLVIITAPENQQRLDRLAEISRSLADPRGRSDAEIEALIREGRSVVAVTCGLHATEIAAAQMAPGLAYRLATAGDPQTQKILRETVFLLFPCFNPDGLDMVAKWVEETRGTRFEGARYPDLYHHYAGHDNNRDAYNLALPESRMFAGVVYREWIPQMYLDVHQMGSYGARLYIPPYHDPINPNVDPLVWMEHELVGANMEIALERAGCTGVVTGAPYTGWWFPSFHMVTNHHNIAGMLTETASARLVWPLYIHPHQLRPHGRSHKVYAPMQLFPHPWPGGWWRLADMIHQQEVSTYALLATAANNRELLLRNMVFKARRVIDRGRKGPIFAYVIPANQHDPLTVEKFIGKLLQNNIEVHRAGADFQVGNRLFHRGDYVVSLAQPNGALVKSLLAEARYPDNAITRRADGSILRPYDMANFVLAEHMGVKTYAAKRPISVALEKLDAPPRRKGSVRGTGAAGWLLSHRYNDSFRAINRILAAGGEVYWLKNGYESGDVRMAPGAIWIPARKTSREAIDRLATELGLDFVALAQPPAGPAFRLKPLRLGMYRRFLGGNMDEGWTRYIFDNWGFPYRRIDVDGIKKGELQKVDVFVLPHDNLRALSGPAQPPRKTGEGEEEEYPEIFLPEKYKKTLDADAVKRIKEFVRGGGTLVALGNACEFAVKKLGLPLRDVTAELPDTEYFCPGSTLRAEFETTHPLAYGMPERGLLLNWSNPVYAVNPSPLNAQIAAPVVYVREKVLKSGWLIGEKRIVGKVAAAVVQYGRGRVILLAFRPQHRAQTHGTYKVFFNALYYGAAEEVDSM